MRAPTIAKVGGPPPPSWRAKRSNPRQRGAGCFVAPRLAMTSRHWARVILMRSCSEDRPRRPRAAMSARLRRALVSGRSAACHPGNPGHELAKPSLTDPPARQPRTRSDWAAPANARQRWRGSARRPGPLQHEVAAGLMHPVQHLNPWMRFDPGQCLEPTFVDLDRADRPVQRRRGAGSPGASARACECGR